MASATQLPGPMEVSEDANGWQSDSSSEKRKAQFELAITLTLFFWPSLSLAVTNQWGGPDSADKREWFAQTTIDVLSETPDADAPWIEEFLLQVMSDEFGVNVDDDSGYVVAEQIVRLRRDCGRGEFGEVLAMKERWDHRGGADVIGGQFKEVERREEEDETDGSVDESDEHDIVEIDETPQLVRVKDKVSPEVDDEGFTKVTKKKR